MGSSESPKTLSVLLLPFLLLITESPAMRKDCKPPNCQSQLDTSRVWWDVSKDSSPLRKSADSKWRSPQASPLRRISVRNGDAFESSSDTEPVNRSPSSARVNKEYSPLDPLQPSGSLLSTKWSTDSADYMSGSVVKLGSPIVSSPNRSGELIFPNINSKVRYYRDQSQSELKWDKMLKELNVKWEQRRKELNGTRNDTYVSLKEKHEAAKKNQTKIATVWTLSTHRNVTSTPHYLGSSSIDSRTPVYKERSSSFRSLRPPSFPTDSRFKDQSLYRRKPTYSSEDESYPADALWSSPEVPVSSIATAKKEERCSGSVCQQTPEKAAHKTEPLSKVAQPSTQTADVSGPSPFQHSGYYPGSYYRQTDSIENSGPRGEGVILGSNFGNEYANQVAGSRFTESASLVRPIPAQSGNIPVSVPEKYPLLDKGTYGAAPLAPPLQPSPIFPPIGGGGTKSGYIGNPYGGKFGNYPQKLKGEFHGWVYPSTGYKKNKSFGGLKYLKDKIYRYKQKLKMIALYPFYKKWQLINSLKSSFYGMGYGKGYDKFGGDFGGMELGGFDFGGKGFGGKGFGGYEEFGGGFGDFGGKGFGGGGLGGGGFGGKGFGGGSFGGGDFGGKGFGGKGFGGMDFGGKGFGGKSFGSYGGFVPPPPPPPIVETYHVSGKLRIKPKGGYAYPG